MSRNPFVSLATAVAALGLAAAPGCSTGASHAAGDAAQAAAAAPAPAAAPVAAERVPWTASPVRAALIDWQAAVGERDVTLEVVGPVDVPVDPAADDGALSLAAGDTTAMVRRMTLRLDGERQEMEVDGPQFLPGNDVGPRVHGLDGLDGQDAWQYAAERPYAHAVIDENGHRELVEAVRPQIIVRLRPESAPDRLTLGWPMVGGRPLAWDAPRAWPGLVAWLDERATVRVRPLGDGRWEVSATERQEKQPEFEGRSFSLVSGLDVVVTMRLDPRPRVETVRVRMATSMAEPPDAAPSDSRVATHVWAGREFTTVAGVDLATHAVVRSVSDSLRPGQGTIGRALAYRWIDHETQTQSTLSSFPPLAAFEPGTVVRDERRGLSYVIGEDRVRTRTQIVRLDAPVSGLLLDPRWQDRVAEVLGRVTPPNNAVLFPGLGED